MFSHKVKVAVTAVAMLGFVVGLGAGVATYVDHRSGGEVDAVLELPRILRAGDALVIADGITIIGAEDRYGDSFLVADLRVTEVLFSAPRASQSMLDDQYPDPPAIGGGYLRVYQPISREGTTVGRLDQLATGEVQLLVLLGYWAPARYPDSPAEWGVEWLAVTDTSGSIDFSSSAGADQAERMAGDLAAAGRAGAPLATDVEHLRAWFAEIVAERSGGPKGPMQVAYELATRTDPYVDWYSSDPANRAVDAESTPPEVLETLTEVDIFIDVAEGARLEGQYVAILSDLGVLHVAHLEGGTHPATVFSDGTGEWRVVITSELSQLGGATSMATVRASEFGPNRGLLVTVNRESGGDWRVSAESSDELATVIGDWLGRQAPTPNH